MNDLTLEEAIAHAEEVADYDCYNDEQMKCADEHRQLAEWLKELKRLKEAATDTDTISRQAAIDALSHMCSEDKNEITVSRANVDSMLRYLPSAQPEQRWIPCSERLPNYREVVLISGFGDVKVAVRDAIKEDGTDDFWDLLLDDATRHPRYVDAWMPLPEPY